MFEFYKNHNDAQDIIKNNNVLTIDELRKLGTYIIEHNFEDICDELLKVPKDHNDYCKNCYMYSFERGYRRINSCYKSPMNLDSYNNIIKYLEHLHNKYFVQFKGTIQHFSKFTTENDAWNMLIKDRGKNILSIDQLKERGYDVVFFDYNILINKLK